MSLESTEDALIAAIVATRGARTISSIGRSFHLPYRLDVGRGPRNAAAAFGFRDIQAAAGGRRSASDRPFLGVSSGSIGIGEIPRRRGKGSGIYHLTTSSLIGVEL